MKQHHFLNPLPKGQAIASAHYQEHLVLTAFGTSLRIQVSYPNEQSQEGHRISQQPRTGTLKLGHRPSLGRRHRMLCHPLHTSRRWHTLLKSCQPTEIQGQGVETRQTGPAQEQYGTTLANPCNTGVVAGDLAADQISRSNDIRLPLKTRRGILFRTRQELKYLEYAKDLLW
jgi:hypothetical protein